MPPGGADRRCHPFHAGHNVFAHEHPFVTTSVAWMMPQARGPWAPLYVWATLYVVATEGIPLARQNCHGNASQLVAALHVNIHDSTIAFMGPCGVTVFEVCPTDMNCMGQDLGLLIHSFKERMCALMGVASMDGCNIQAVVTSKYVDIRWKRARNLPVQLVNHHEAHASAAFWESGFKSAIALVIDGGLPHEPGRCLLARLSYGSSGEIKVQRLSQCGIDIMRWRKPLCGHRDTCEAWAGRFNMTVNQGLQYLVDVAAHMQPGGHCSGPYPRSALKRMVKCDFQGQAIQGWDLEWAKEVSKLQRDVTDAILWRLTSVDQHLAAVEGIVLTGGGAFNWLWNRQVALQMKKPLYVPCNPRDGIVTLGMLLHQYGQAIPGQPQPVLVKATPKLWSSPGVEVEHMQISAPKAAALLSRGELVVCMNGHIPLAVPATKCYSSQAYVLAAPSEKNLQGMRALAGWLDRRVPCLVTEEAAPSVVDTPVDSHSHHMGGAFLPSIIRQYPFLDRKDRPVHAVAQATNSWLHETLRLLAWKHSFLFMEELPLALHSRKDIAAYLQTHNLNVSFISIDSTLFRTIRHASPEYSASPQKTSNKSGA